MPVHKVEGGYQWGKTGKVYKSRAKAEAQGRAIYSSGYTGDAETFDGDEDLFEPSKRQEKALLHALKRMTSGLEDILGLYDPREPELAINMLNKRAEQLEELGQAYANRAFRSANDRSIKQWSRSDVYKSLSPSAKDAVMTASTQGARIEFTRGFGAISSTLASSTAQRIQDINNGTLYANATENEKQKQINRSIEILKNRVKAIARTENARLNSLLVQVRAESAGSTHYIWQSREDARVRPMHAALSGTTQSWLNPPLCDKPDYHAHAGQIFNCRCVPVPIFPRWVLKM